MATPRSVVEEGKRANELIQQLAKGDPADQQRGQDAPPGQPRGAAPPVGEQPAAPPQENWEKRFKGLQRTHEATVSQLKARDAEIAQREAEWHERFTELERKLNEQNASRPVQLDRSFLNEDEVTLFGEENLRIVERVAAEAANRAVQTALAQQQQKFEAAEIKRKAELSEAEKKTDFKSRLKGLVDEFERIDTDPKFAEWLKGVDPIVGVPRSERLRRAVQIHDVGLAASIYNEFQASKTAPDPRARSVMPRTQGSPPPRQQGQGNKRMWTREQISQFYNDKTLGRYRSRPEEARAIEVDIIAAQQEGRIIG